VKDAVTGDFGDSLFYKEPAIDVVMDRFPNTLKLVAVAAGFGIPIGLLLGMLCAIKRNKAFDILGRTTAVLGQSLPGFWIGIMLILLFSVRWEIFPAAGMGGPLHYVLPPVAMGAFLVAGVTRLTRSSMLEVLGKDYITFARAKGTAESSVIVKHALRNAAIPVLTFTGPLVAAMMANAVVTETVFAWPGVGRLAYESTLGKDFAVMQVIVLLFGTILIFTNLLVDILYGWFDPRIRYQ
jgi:peptide/nickel transport system permease protein